LLYKGDCFLSMAKKEFRNLTYLTPDVAQKEFYAAGEWIDPDPAAIDEQHAITAVVLADGSVRFPSAQQRIKAAGGVVSVGRVFQESVKEKDYGSFTLFMANEPTVDMDVLAGALLVDAGNPHEFGRVYTTADRLMEANLLQPAGDIVVLVRNFTEPGKIGVFPGEGFQRTTEGTLALEGFRATGEPVLPQQQRRAPRGRHRPRGRRG
jgi:hypothetical protein